MYARGNRAMKDVSKGNTEFSQTRGQMRGQALGSSPCMVGHAVTRFYNPWIEQMHYSTKLKGEDQVS